MTTSQISQIIFFLWKKRYQGIINIGSGIKINIELIAQKFATKLNKKISFNKNRPTFLIADNSKLKKIGYNKKI